MFHGCKRSFRPCVDIQRGQTALELLFLMTGVFGFIWHRTPVDLRAGSCTAHGARLCNGIPLFVAGFCPVVAFSPTAWPGLIIGTFVKANGVLAP